MASSPNKARKGATGGGHTLLVTAGDPGVAAVVDLTTVFPHLGVPRALVLGPQGCPEVLEDRDGPHLLCCCFPAPPRGPWRGRSH